MYPDPAAAVDPGTPTKTLTFGFGADEAQFCHVSKLKPLDSTPQGGLL
jgi:hypothetical protein